jgi:hypothetical protein
MICIGAVIINGLARFCGPEDLVGSRECPVKPAYAERRRATTEGDHVRTAQEKPQMLTAAEAS